MGIVISSAATSLDGFVAHPDSSPGPLFDWYDAEQTGGSVTVQNAGDLPAFVLTPESAEHVAAGVVAAQAYDAGLLDAVAVDLVPVFLGEGHRYLTAAPGDAP